VTEQVQEAYGNNLTDDRQINDNLLKFTDASRGLLNMCKHTLNNLRRLTRIEFTAENLTTR